MQAKFSRRGEAPTLFEQGLVNHASEQRLSEMRSAWLIIGKRIGPLALAAVFDELGGSTVHVPDRGEFFRALYEPLRNEQIRAARADGADWGALSQRFGLSRSQLARICAADGDA